MDTWTVYMHISPSGKKYIGITSSRVENRWKNGLGYKSQLFYRAIQKYGWENIEHIILAEGLTKQKAEDMEKELIAQYNTRTPNGYNLSNGGLGSSGHLMTEEGRKILSEKLKGRKISAETIQKRKERLKNRSEAETRRIYSIISSKMLGGKHSSAKRIDRYTLDNQYIDSFDSIHDIERQFNYSFKNISACCRGIQFSAYGYKWCYSGEYPITHIHAQSKSIDRFTMKGEFIDTFPSITIAAKELNLSNACRAHISQCCNGQRKSAGGYMWRYSDKGE